MNREQKRRAAALAKKAAKRPNRTLHTTKALTLTHDQKVELRDAIAAAVQRVVPQTPLNQACLYYAVATRAVLAEIDPETSWFLQAGSVVVETGNCDAEGPLCYGLEFSPSSLGGTTEVHAWVAAPATLVLVDFSARHFVENSEAIGLAWSRQPLDYVWQDARELEKDGFDYRPDPEAFPLAESFRLGWEDKLSVAVQAEFELRRISFGTR
jgi:hypothetical protein